MASWCCKNCGLCNSVKRIQCQACFQSDDAASNVSPDANDIEIAFQIGSYLDVFDFVNLYLSQTFTGLSYEAMTKYITHGDYNLYKYENQTANDIELMDMIENHKVSVSRLYTVRESEHYYRSFVDEIDIKAKLTAKFYQLCDHGEYWDDWVRERNYYQFNEQHPFIDDGYVTFKQFDYLTRYGLKMKENDIELILGYLFDGGINIEHSALESLKIYTLTYKASMNAYIHFRIACFVRNNDFRSQKALFLTCVIGNYDC